MSKKNLIILVTLLSLSLPVLAADDPPVRERRVRGRQGNAIVRTFARVIRTLML